MGGVGAVVVEAVAEVVEEGVGGLGLAWAVGAEGGGLSWCNGEEVAGGEGKA